MGNNIYYFIACMLLSILFSTLICVLIIKIQKDIVGKTLTLGGTTIMDRDLIKLVNNTFPGLSVNGDLQVNSNSQRPIILNKTSGSDSTNLISFTNNNNEYNAMGLNPNGLPWNGENQTCIGFTKCTG